MVALSDAKVTAAVGALVERVLEIVDQEHEQTIAASLGAKEIKYRCFNVPENANEEAHDDADQPSVAANLLVGAGGNVRSAVLADAIERTDVCVRRNHRS